MVEETTSKTIAQIFSELGENEFRDREACAVDTACRRTQPHIISLGGGAILRDANRQLIKSHGWTAWLAATPEELARRISGDPLTQRNRPALSKLGAIDEINTILQSRTPTLLLDRKCNLQYRGSVPRPTNRSSC